MDRENSAVVELTVSDYSQLGSLRSYLSLTAPDASIVRSPGLAGRGEQGALDVLVILADSSVLIAGVKTLPDFLRSRKTSVSITIKTKKKQVILTSANADEVIPILERLLNG